MRDETARHVRLHQIEKSWPYQLEPGPGHFPIPAGAASPRFRRLLPAGAPASVTEVIEALGLWDRPARADARPHVMLNMISTADGRATLDGRSGTISESAKAI